MDALHSIVFVKNHMQGKDKVRGVEDCTYVHTIDTKKELLKNNNTNIIQSL